MNTLFEIHSGIRWLIVAIGALTLIRMAIGLIGRQVYDRLAMILMRLLAAAIGVQILVGLIYLVWNGIDADYWPTERFIHAAVMLVVGYLAGNVPRRWENAPAQAHYRNDLLVIVVVLILVFVGVSVLPGGTARWEL